MTMLKLVCSHAAELLPGAYVNECSDCCQARINARQTTNICGWRYDDGMLAGPVHPFVQRNRGAIEFIFGNCSMLSPFSRRKASTFCQHTTASESGKLQCQYRLVLCICKNVMCIKRNSYAQYLKQQEEEVALAVGLTRGQGEWTVMGHLNCLDAHSWFDDGFICSGHNTQQVGSGQSGTYDGSYGGQPGSSAPGTQCCG
jgi:hypothetical protein